MYSTGAGSTSSPGIGGVSTIDKGPEYPSRFAPSTGGKKDPALAPEVGIVVLLRLLTLL